MLSLPHLVVLFVIALVIFGPQKLPELARMLGKATAEFRKMTSDFRYALEDEVRELERQTRIREEEVAAAVRAAQSPTTSPSPTAPPDGAVSRETPAETSSGPGVPPSDTNLAEHIDLGSSGTQPADPLSVPHEKSPDDNTVV